MNELTNTSLITLAVFATIGAVASIVFITLIIHHWCDTALRAKYRGLVRQIEDTSYDMIQMLHKNGQQTAEFRWACDTLCRVATHRDTMHTGELQARLKKARDFFEDEASNR